MRHRHLHFGSWLAGFGLLAYAATLSPGQVRAHDGGLHLFGRRIAIWANSPEASLWIDNTSGSFYHAKVHWRNVLAGAYVETAQGVADAATAAGGTLNAEVTVPPGSQASWRLRPNLEGDYQFAVVGGRLGALEGLARKWRGGHRLRFAIQLGDTGWRMGSLQGALGRLHFPTYLLPGTRDSLAAFEREIGEPDEAFWVARDRFVFVNDRAHYLGSGRLGWLHYELREAKSMRARRIFVFLPVPLVDPRRHHGDALWSRREVRALLGMFQDYRVTGVFAGHLPFYDHQVQDDTRYVIPDGRYGEVVEVRGRTTVFAKVPT